MAAGNSLIRRAGAIGGIMHSVIGTSDILIILDGDLTSIVGAAMLRDELLGASGCRGWAVIAPGVGAAASLRRAAAIETADAFGFSIALQQRADESQNQVLIRSVEAARERGCGRISWPIHAGGVGVVDLDEAARLVHRASLAARLVQLASADAAPITIRADVVDLADEQVADLVLDVDAPVRLAWWWDAVLVPRVLSDNVPTERTLDALARLKLSQLRRWLPVLVDAGVDVASVSV
jgi:hypothetical protein